MDICKLFSLEGKTALVTGGSMGIGRATALAFADAGADVAIVSRKMENLAPVAEEIQARGRKCVPVAAHVGRMDQIPSIVEQVVAGMGKIDILVNNAATSPAYATVLEAGEKLWDSIISLNLKGLYFLSQAVARIMKEKAAGGSIINVSSIDGFQPQAQVGIYSISKAGVNMATRSMALELAPHKIRVNAIAPGATRTKLFEGLFAFLPEDQREEQIRQIGQAFPLGRVAVPDDMVGLMLYLASDASAYMTGQIVAVEGGVLLHGGL
ncbi:MAG: SDR family NAD(P)-dependent oxidoreductase [Thermodesulfobacteriota bacterium]